MALPSAGETHSYGVWSVQENILNIGLNLEEFSEVSRGQHNDPLVLACWPHDGYKTE